jgi:hypothetical protein
MPTFSAIGQPMLVPIYPNSQATKFSTAGKIPMQVDNLTFKFINRLPFEVRLDGYADEANFTAVIEGKGHLILARVESGVMVSKRPKWISAGPFASPGLPLPVEGQDGWTWGTPEAPTCFLELRYGRGD